MGESNGELAERVSAAVRRAKVAGTAAAIAAALNAVHPDELAAFFHAALDVDTDIEPIATGLPASPGAATGRVVFTAEDAVDAVGRGEAVILVRSETTPEDVIGMQSSRGILTARGGMVSHAAVVARGWGIPAVVGVGEMLIAADHVRIGTTTLRAGDQITISGTTGHVYTGALHTTSSEPPPELETLLHWADRVALGAVQVRVNADTEGDASKGRCFGAQGIGLCRTEHMFLATDRLTMMRRFILADDDETERAALAELETAQASDFENVLEAMDGLPVTVRLLDPPLHEFLPDLFDLHARDVRGELDDDSRREFAAARRMHEVNPMIGTRGVRLGMVRPGLYEMQVRSLCRAAATLIERGRKPCVEIMIPLVVDAEELRIAREWVSHVLDEVGHPELSSTVVTVGVMIETPRAALTAREIARYADFLSFGTNDLTQMTYAFSRDDVESKLLPTYLARGILPDNPFEVLDEQGVGELIRIACAAARSAKPSIKLGVCGEHAGHPASAAFLVRLGLDSVSCSPFRVPLARLAVAQSLIACGRVDLSTVDFTSHAAVSDAADMVRHDAGLDENDVAIDEALVLHTLRVRGFVTAAGFAESLGGHPAELLAELIAKGEVRHVDRLDAYGLLPPGRERQEALLSTYVGVNVAAGLEAHYQRFLALNQEFKNLCTDWQVRDGQPNDHSDQQYDSTCIARLLAFSAASRDTLQGFATVLPRMRRYIARLDEAVRAVESGESKRFTGVMCGSYHDIWMELHEDLVVLQRIDRVAEGSF